MHAQDDYDHLQESSDRASRSTTDNGIIALYNRLRDEEVKICQTCLQRGMKPFHFISHYFDPQMGKLTISDRCQSNGRRFDIETRQFVGNAHCSCDSCF